MATSFFYVKRETAIFMASIFLFLSFIQTQTSEYFIFYLPFLFIFNKFLDRTFRQRLINYSSQKLVKKNNRKSLFLGQVVEMK